MGYRPVEYLHGNKLDEDRWVGEIQRLHIFIEKHNLSSAEVEAAYLLAMGASSDDENIKPYLSDDVRTLAKFIKNDADIGLPLNEIGNIITQRRELENKKDLRAKIDELER